MSKTSEWLDYLERTSSDPFSIEDRRRLIAGYRLAVAERDEWEYEPDEIECERVERVEVTVKQWKACDPAK